jgi:hypothetical protein
MYTKDNYAMGTDMHTRGEKGVSRETKTERE